MVHSLRFAGICPLLLLLILLPAKTLGQEIQQPSTNHFEQGMQLFENGLYKEAATELNTFVRNYPEHELVISAEFYRTRALGKVDSVTSPDYFEQFIRKYPRTEFTKKLLFELAERSKKKNDFDGAIRYYRRSLNHGLDKKTEAQVYYWMAEASVSGNNNRQARSLFLTLADRYPDSEWAPKALYARGRLYLSENRYDSSSVAFELLKERFPNHEMTRRIGTALGESYYLQGKYKEAVEAFKNASPYLEGELKSKAVYLIAESYNYLNDFDNASTYYLQYINRTKGTDEVRKAHYGLGWVYHKQQIYHWAANSFEKAATGDDELARKALYYKAVNEKMGGRYPDAIESFRTFGERYTSGQWIEEAYYEWAITAFEMGNYGEAIEVLLPLVRNEQNLDWAGKIYTLLGEAYFANKEYTRALQAFEAAEKVTDVDPAIKRQARFQKAWVQYRNQAYKQAQPIFESVYNETPGSEIGKEALFWSADAYYHMNQYGPASVQFSKFISENPGHEMAGAARYSLGWSYFNMGDYARAAGPFIAFLENYEPPSVSLYPYDTDTKLRIGDSFYASGEYDRAISYYEKAIGAEPGGDYAMFQIANCHYRAENTYEAVTTFRRFLRIYPYSPLREQAQYNIAYIYLNTSNYTQAIEEFQTVINKYPNTTWAARAQYNIGDAYYNAGEYDKAIEAYREVMEEYPRSDYIIEAVNGIQYAQLSSGKADSSSAILEDFLTRHPQATTADRLRYRQAENLMQTGDYKRAIEEFRQYVRITNNQQLLPDAHFNLANAYEETGQIDRAIEAYREVAEQFPGTERHAPSLASLGRIAYNQGRYQDSYNHFSRLLEQGRQYRLEARIGMGNAHLAMNNPDEARKHYEAALEVNSNYDPARVGLGKVAMNNQNYEEAADYLALVAESNTTEVGAEAQYLLGLIKQRQKQYQEAISAYSNVNILYEAFDGWVAKALLGSAQCYIQMGNRAEAINMLEVIVDKYPGTPEARQAKQLLESN